MDSELVILALVAGLVIALALAIWRMRLLQRQVADAERPLRAVLEQARRQQDGILKAVDEALLVLDGEQRILLANTTAEALIGRDPTGETLIQMVDSPQLVELVQSAQLVRGEGMERRIEFGQRILHARAVALQDGPDPLEVLALDRKSVV